MTVLGLFLNPSMRSGGHKRYLELLGGLAGRGVRVIAFMNRVQPTRPPAVEIIESDVRTGPLHPSSRAFTQAVLRDLGRIPRDVGRIDWIVVFGETHFAAAVALKKKLGSPILYSHRSNAVREGIVSLEENKGKPLAVAAIRLGILRSRLYERYIARRADVLVFQSPYDREDFLSRERSCAQRSLVIRGNIGEPRFKKEYEGTNSSDRLRRVLFIGTFGERKGVKYFLEAASILASRGFRDIEYELIGFGSRKKEFEDFSERAGLSASVRFLGRLADPFPALARSDLLVVPSLFDSYPNTVLEALHVGTPVIASAIGGIPDMLRHEELLFPIRDARAIADRIERCVTDSAFYGRIRTLCAERVSFFHFDWSGAFIEAMRDRG